jgi:hypothetical protein
MKETIESIKSAATSMEETQQDFQSSVSSANRVVLKGRRLHNINDGGPGVACDRRTGPKSPATRYLHVCSLFIPLAGDNNFIMILGLSSPLLGREKGPYAT